MADGLPLEISRFLKAAKEIDELGQLLLKQHSVATDRNKTIAREIRYLVSTCDHEKLIDKMLEMARRIENGL